MDYARQQRNPARHAIGIALVVLVHALVIYALVTGLDRAVVEVIEKPVTVAIIDEVSAPPQRLPPLLAPLLAPGKIVDPPTIRIPVKPQLPRPAIPVPAPVPLPVKSAVTARPPTVPEAIAPPAPVPAPLVSAPPAVVRARPDVAMAPPAVVHAPAAVAPPTVGQSAPTVVKAAPGPASVPPPPKPAVRRGIVPIEREDPVYPRAAIRANVTRGRVVARLQIDEQGSVTDVEIRVSEPPRIFDRAVRTALERWKFKPDGEKYLGEIVVNFSLKEE